MDSQLQTLKLSLDTLLQEISDEELNWHPEGKWCPAEILEHLYLTYTGTTKGLSRVEEAGKSLAGRPTWSHRLRKYVVVGAGYFPPGRKSPRVAEPRGLSRQRVVAEIASKIIEMDQILARCESKFGARTKLLDHPVLGPLTAAEWRKFHLVHGRHHLKQIERLRRAMKSSS
jgi:DinB superfamily